MLKRIAGVIALAALCVTGCKKGQEDAAKTGAAPGASASTDGKGTPSGSASGTAQAEAKPIEGCNSDLKQVPTANTTFTKACSPYSIENDLSVDGWDLTIEPGVEIRMGDRAMIYVGNTKSGRITARGTAEAPIRFVGQRRQEPGAWRGFQLTTRANGSVFEHVIVEHAGNEDYGIFENRDGQVTYSNVKFVSCKDLAISQSGQGPKLKISDSDFTGVEPEGPIVKLTPVSVAELKNNKFPEKAYIQSEGALEASVTFQDPGAPIRLVNDLELKATPSGEATTVTFGPGVRVQVVDNRSIYVGTGDASTLKLQGTAEKPVVFTSATADSGKGSWRGFIIGPHGRPATVEHVVIENAGQKDGYVFEFRSDAPARFANVTVRGSKGHGLVIRSEKERWESFENNTFEDVDEAVVSAPAEMVHKVGAGNKFPADSRFEVFGTVGRDTVWTAQTIPYVVSNDIELRGESNAKPSTLTIEPGTMVKFGSNTQLYVGSSNPGTLSAVGTAEKPITFTALNDDWRGIRTYQHGKLTVQNAVFEKVGSDYYGLTIDNGAAGTVKQVKFNEAAKAMRKCSPKVTTDQVEAGGGEIVTEC